MKALLKIALLTTLFIGCNSATKDSSKDEVSGNSTQQNDSTLKVSVKLPLSEGSKNTIVGSQQSSKSVGSQQSLNSDVLDKIVLENVSLKCRGTGTRAASVYGSGVTFYFTITNNSSKGIKTVFLNGKFNYDGRSFYHSENINYEFRKGLESGETEKIVVRPGPLSQWNDKIKPSDRGKLELKLLKVEDYDGKIWKFSTSKNTNL